jgi:hypothetical protein
MKRFRSIFALVVAGSCVCGPAVAGDVRCLWDHAPQAARDHLLSIAEGGADPAKEDFSAIADAMTGGGACGVSDAKKEPAKRALLGYALVEYGIHWLEFRKVATRAQLDAGWKTTDGVLRQQAIDDAAAPAGEAPSFPTKAIESFLAGTGLADAMYGEGNKALLSYFGGRLILAANEPKF